MSHDKASRERIMKGNSQSLDIVNLIENTNDVLSVNDALNKSDGGNEIGLQDIRDHHRQHKDRPAVLVCIETETYILHCVSEYA